MSTNFKNCFLVFLVYLSISFEAMAGMIIKDSMGNQVGLYKQSHALVVGVSNYTNGWPTLTGVKKDVTLVKQVLEEHGFQVEVVMDPDSNGLRNAYKNFIDRYGHKPDNRLLFYFAGHGHTLKLDYGDNMGYIVPKGAPNPNQDKSGFLKKALDMEMMAGFAKRIESKHALFLFDSCFSGSIFSLSRAIPENISYKTSKPVRQFITAGSANETVPDESIFRAQFISALRGEGDTDQDGFITGVELGEFLQKTVMNYSNGSQHPQYGKIRNPRLDKGDFVFLIKPSSFIKEPSPSVLDDKSMVVHKSKLTIQAPPQLKKNGLKYNSEVINNSQGEFIKKDVDRLTLGVVVTHRNTNGPLVSRMALAKSYATRRAETIAREALSQHPYSFIDNQIDSFIKGKTIKDVETLENGKMKLIFEFNFSSP